MQGLPQLKARCFNAAWERHTGATPRAGNRDGYSPRGAPAGLGEPSPRQATEHGQGQALPPATPRRERGALPPALPGRFGSPSTRKRPPSPRAEEAARSARRLKSPPQEWANPQSGDEALSPPQLERLRRIQQACSPRSGGTGQLADRRAQVYSQGLVAVKSPSAGSLASPHARSQRNFHERSPLEVDERAFGVGGRSSWEEPRSSPRSIGSVLDAHRSKPSSRGRAPLLPLPAAAAAPHSGFADSWPRPRPEPLDPEAVSPMAQMRQRLAGSKPASAEQGASKPTSARAAFGMLAEQGVKPGSAGTPASALRPASSAVHGTGRPTVSGEPSPMRHSVDTALDRFGPTSPMRFGSPQEPRRRSFGAGMRPSLSDRDQPYSARRPRPSVSTDRRPMSVGVHSESPFGDGTSEEARGGEDSPNSPRSVAGRFSQDAADVIAEVVNFRSPRSSGSIVGEPGSPGRPRLRSSATQPLGQRRLSLASAGGDGESFDQKARYLSLGEDDGMPISARASGTVDLNGVVGARAAAEEPSSPRPGFGRGRTMGGQGASAEVEDRSSGKVKNFALKRSSTLARLMQRADRATSLLANESSSAAQTLNEKDPLELAEELAEKRRQEEAIAAGIEEEDEDEEEEAIEEPTVDDGSAEKSGTPEAEAEEEPDAEAQSEEDSRRFDMNGFPKHLRVMGVNYRQANGVYTLQPGRRRFGRPYWQKRGTAFSLQFTELPDDPGERCPSRLFRSVATQSSNALGGSIARAWERVKKRARFFSGGSDIGLDDDFDTTFSRQVSAAVGNDEEGGLPVYRSAFTRQVSGFSRQVSEQVEPMVEDADPAQPAFVYDMTLRGVSTASQDTAAADFAAPPWRARRFSDSAFGSSFPAIDKAAWISGRQSASSETAGGTSEDASWSGDSPSPGPTGSERKRGVALSLGNADEEVEAEREAEEEEEEEEEEEVWTPYQPLVEHASPRSRQRALSPVPMGGGNFDWKSRLSLPLDSFTEDSDEEAEAEREVAEEKAWTPYQPLVEESSPTASRRALSPVPAGGVTSERKWRAAASLEAFEEDADEEAEAEREAAEAEAAALEEEEANAEEESDVDDEEFEEAIREAVADVPKPSRSGSPPVLDLKRLSGRLESSAVLETFDEEDEEEDDEEETFDEERERVSRGDMGTGDDDTEDMEVCRTNRGAVSRHMASPALEAATPTSRAAKTAAMRVSIGDTTIEYVKDRREPRLIQIDDDISIMIDEDEAGKEEEGGRDSSRYETPPDLPDSPASSSGRHTGPDFRSSTRSMADLRSSMRSVGESSFAPTPAPRELLLPGSDMEDPGWIGWILGLFSDGDTITFLRSGNAADSEAEDEDEVTDENGEPVLSIPELPSKVRVWESNADSDNGEWENVWNVRIEMAPVPPELVYLNHSTGSLGGTFKLGDEVGGRFGYEREDERAKMFWDAEGQQWVVEQMFGSATEFQRYAMQISGEDTLDPTHITGFESWREAEKAWMPDGGLSCHAGHAPPPQIYVTCCQRRCLVGVYNIRPEPVEGKPAYQKDSPDGNSGCAIRWHSESMSWYFDVRGVGGGDAEGEARSVEDVQLPHMCTSWEEIVGDISMTASQGCEMQWEESLIQLDAILETPAELFVEIAGEGAIVSARGVYYLQPDKVAKRCCYAKSTAAWKLYWEPKEVAWILSDASASAKGRAARDVPVPSMTVDGSMLWEVLDGTISQDWFTTEAISVQTMPPPPRRVYVTGNHDDSVIYGVYFLRGMRNNRPMYGKEAIAIGDTLSLDRGVISWGGGVKAVWMLVCKAGDAVVASAELADDIPVPTIKPILDWTIDEKGGTPKGDGGTSRSLRRTASTEGAGLEVGGGLGRFGKQPGSGRKGGSPFAAWKASRSKGGSSRGGIGALGFAVGAKKWRGGKLGPLGMPIGAGNMRDAKRFGGSGLMISTEAAFDDEDDEEPEEEKLKLQCLPADDSPSAIFLSGFAPNMDGVFFIQPELSEGRPVFQNEFNTAKLHWVRQEQRWRYSSVGVSSAIWEEQVSLKCDAPDPTQARLAWEEIVSASRANSPESRTSTPSNDATVEEDGVGAVIKEEGEEDEDEAKTDEKESRTSRTLSMAMTATGSSKADKDKDDEDVIHRKGLADIACIIVEPPPRKVFVVAPSHCKSDFTGVFILDPDSANERRPRYIAERVGNSTPCTLTWLSAERRWIITRVPKLGGNVNRLAKAASASLAFVLAGVQYDAPDPSRVNTTWEIRNGSTWKKEEGVLCRVVRPTPLRICILGETDAYDDVMGTYVLESDDELKRPVYLKEGTDQTVVRYHLEARRWIVDRAGLGHTSSLGTYFVDCNVPNPTETLTSAWMSIDKSAAQTKMSSEDTLGCYAGDLPPKQVYVTGGRGWLPGVYTFAWRRTHNERFLYWKEGTNWYIWWSVRHKAWVVSAVHKGDLNIKIEKKKITETGEAWSLEDQPHPVACSAWRWKAKSWQAGGRTDTLRGVLTSLEAAKSCGERFLEVVPVEKPPHAVVIRQGSDRKIMAGVYFLAPNLHRKRCCFVKQCNMRRNDMWVCYYDPPTAKWNLSRHGLAGKEKPNAFVVCDCPDPTMVYLNWTVRNALGKTAISWTTRANVPSEIPDRIFVFGAYEKKVEGNTRMTVHLPANGVYIQQEQFHNRRPVFRKEVDPLWVLRFHVKSARWIIDGRKPEGAVTKLYDDSAGTCSVVSDSWHPVEVDTTWAIWNAGQKKVRDNKAKGKVGGGTANEDKVSGTAPAGPATGSIADLAGGRQGGFRLPGGRRQNEKNDSQRLTAGNLELAFGKVRRSQAAESVNSGDGASSLGSGGSKSAAGMSSRMSSSGMSVGSRRSLASGRSGRAKSVSGSSMGSQLSGSVGSVEEEDDLPKNVEGRAYESWVDFPSIAVMEVDKEPQRIHAFPAEPHELGGIYVVDGYHCGRPAYRLVDEHGQFKTRLESVQQDKAPPNPVGLELTGLSEAIFGAHDNDSCSSVVEPQNDDQRSTTPVGSSSASGADGAVNTGLAGAYRRKIGAFHFSTSGYAIRWHSATRQWVLGEYCKVLQVRYNNGSADKDLTLVGGDGDPVTVSYVRYGGPASQAGVPIDSELLAINGDKEAFRFQDASCILSFCDSPDIELEFKVPGYALGTEGHMYLQYDAPYPCSIGIGWKVAFDGQDLLFPPEKPMQCRILETPPRRLKVSTATGKPREFNGPFELAMLLHEGRPAFQRGRWSIYWAPVKRRWIICQGAFGHAESEGGKALAYATCYAPHPAATRAHGGQWETKSRQLGRGLKVEVLDGHLDSSEYQEMLLATLKAILDNATSLNTIQGVVKDGRTRYDVKRINAVLAHLGKALDEAQTFGCEGELISRAGEVRTTLAGYLLLESLLKQGEKEKATTASWMETLTELRACIRQDKADTSVCYQDGWTAMHLVACYGPTEAWTFDAAYALQAGGANVEAADEIGMTPTMLALAHEKPGNVKAFLRLSVEAAVYLPMEPAPTVRSEGQQLMQVASEADIDALEKFCKHLTEVTVSVRGPRGITALHIVAKRNQPSMVELLVRTFGAGVDLQDDQGNTALHFAVLNNASLATIMLLRVGASPTLRNMKGATPFMIALEDGAANVLHEMQESMLPWEDIESIIGKQRHAEAQHWEELVRDKVRELIDIGFGHPRVDPMHTNGQRDKLQLVNQVVILDPSIGPRRRSCLEFRGILLCQELLLPLLSLAGTCELEVDDGINYQGFLNYMLSAGFGVFAGIDVALSVQRGIEALGRSCDDLFESVVDDMRTLSQNFLSFVGRAASGENDRQWEFRHHFYAHGELPWLTKDGTKRSVLHALGAITEAGGMSSIVEMVKVALPQPKKLLQATSEAQVRAAFVPFWEVAYARWLLACADKASAHLGALLTKRKEEHTIMPAQNLNNILSAKEDYREMCRNAFGFPQEERSLAGVSPPHHMEAGGVTDLVRCRLVANGADSMRKLWRDFTQMTMDKEGCELVYVVNDFYGEPDTRSIRKISFGCLLKAGTSGCILGEVNVILQKYDWLRWHRELLENYDEGIYSDSTIAMRSLCGTRDGIQATSTGTDALRANVGGGAPRSALAPFRRRFGIVDIKGGQHAPLAVWWWCSHADCKRNGYTAVPEGSDILRVNPTTGLAETCDSTRWEEIRAEDRPELPLEAVTTDAERCIPRDTLSQHLLDFADKDIERLIGELVSSVCRLFSSPDGTVTKVTDHVVLRVQTPDEEAVLVRESKPTGCPMMPRRGTETLEAVAKKLVNGLPPFLRSELVVEPFHPDNGSWVMRDLGEEAVKARSVLPTAKRYFVVKARFVETPDPFNLLRCAVNIDDTRRGG